VSVTKVPTWLPPMLATLAREAPVGGEWVYERKLDGIRALAFCDGGKVRLLSRNKLALGFDPVVRALEDLGTSAILDGEVVAFAGARTSFELLQQRGGGRVQLRYYVFDVLHIDGQDVRGRPLLERKDLLKGSLPSNDVLKYSTHRSGNGNRLHTESCTKGWEGLIAKRADAPYRAGRSKDWLKLKCTLEQEFVIGGFTDPKGSRVGLGALMLGYHDDGAFRFAGEVGTGFSDALLRMLTSTLHELERPASPFDDLPKRAKGVHFVQPKLVCQVGFSEWTRDGKLRHPRFLGLRQDKSPNEVIRERPT
jgi:bifunctional non-homologous end joining protein LigD